MIRVFVLGLGLIVLWLLFLSNFSKQKKIILSLVAIAIGVAGVLYESYGETPRRGLIGTDQVVSCGVTVEHSYRSNYNITFCLQNNAAKASVKRIEVRFIAENCASGTCQELDAVTKAFSMEIAPQTSAEHTVNLAFDKLQRGSNDFNWRTELVKVKATR